MRKLRAENRELKRANDILKSASVFFTAEQGRKQQVIIDYINRYKSEYCVEPICTVLSEHDCSIAAFAFCEARNRSTSRRTARATKSARLRSAVYMPRTIRSTAPARCGWKCGEKESAWRGARSNDFWVFSGSRARRGKKKRTTTADPQGGRAEDLVQQKFNPVAPNMLW